VLRTTEFPSGDHPAIHRPTGRPYAHRGLLPGPLDLRRDIEFGCRVTAAHYDEVAGEWEAVIEDGRRARARFLVTAIGPLSAPTMPTIPGVETFRGEAYHTGRWPHEPVSFAGKRVAVIGTGATGVQAITEIAKTVGHLTVFQRTPNWCAPLHNSPIDAATQARIRATYPEIFARCRASFGCFIHDADPRKALEVSPAEREAFFEKLYREPGFGIWMGNFRDVLVDAAANVTITAFMRRKIRERVKDPALAEQLIPTNHGFGTRRVPLESGYDEVFNQPNVRLVDVRETPIERISATGIRTTAAQHDVDMTVYATGFDAIIGAFDRIDIRGRDGCRLRDAWADGPSTYLGLQIPGFPNLFTLVGPHNAATFCNIPRCIEQNVDWVTALLADMAERGRTRVEPTADAAGEWTQHVHDTGRRMLFTQVDSWMMGINTNVAGKDRRTFVVYAGGAPRYCDRCARSRPPATRASRSRSVPPTSSGRPADDRRDTQPAGRRGRGPRRVRALRAGAGRQGRGRARRHVLEQPAHDPLCAERARVRLRSDPRPSRRATAEHQGTSRPPGDPDPRPRPGDREPGIQGSRPRADWPSEPDVGALPRARMEGDQRARLDHRRDLRR
jgi:cation diffusion facilitator CzcD-associated flavoprotein CzcO